MTTPAPAAGRLRAALLALLAAAAPFFGPAAAPLDAQARAAPAQARSLPWASSAGAVGMAPERLERVRSTLQRYVDRGEVAGATAVVLRDGKLVAYDSVGVMEAGAGRPMQGSALFRIASMTKPVTSVAAMILVEEGRLGLSDPVAEYIPAFSDVTVAVEDEGGVREVPAERPMTVRHLLTHRSGLTYGFLDDGPVGEMYAEAGVTDGIGNREITLAENVARLAELPLVHQPGEAWQYGLSTDVLGRVVEVASGQSLDAFFRERILRPLGMDDTHFQVPPEKVSRVATIHRVGEEGGGPEPLDLPVVTGTRYLSGGAGLYSTARDYARFLQMLLDGGVLDGVRILSPRSVELMTRSHSEDLASSGFSSASDFGLGFAVVDDPGLSGTMASVGSYSWGGIYGTTFWVDPAEGLIGVGMIQLSPDTADDFGRDLRTAVYQALTASRTFGAGRR